FLAQLAESMKRFDLALRLAQLGWGGEGFADCLSIYLTGQAIVRAVARLAWFVAPAIRLSAAASDAANRAAAQVAAIANAPQDLRALLFEHGQRFRQDCASTPNVSIRKEFCHKKRTRPTATVLSRTRPGPERFSSTGLGRLDYLGQLTRS